jgi:hypothetical protein
MEVLLNAKIKFKPRKNITGQNNNKYLLDWKKERFSSLS